MIRVSDPRLACADGSKLTARFRNIHVAWDEQGKNERTRCFALLVLELRRGESVEFNRSTRVSNGYTRDRLPCRIAIGNYTRLRPGRMVSCRAIEMT